MEQTNLLKEINRKPKIMSELIVKPEQFQLETEKASNIQKSFLPKLQEQKAYSTQYQELLEREITPELVDDASNLRKKLKKVRTSTDKIRKSEKNYYLQAGKFVDALGKKIMVPVKEMEDKLEEIEDYYDRLEREKQEKIANERYEALESYVEDPYVYNVGEMEQEVFDSFLFAKKEEFKIKQKEEEERLKREQEEEELQKKYSKRKDDVLSLGEYFDWDKLTKNTTEEDFNKLKSEAINKKQKKDKELKELKRQQEQQRKEQEKLNKKRDRLKPYYSIPNIEIDDSIVKLDEKKFNLEIDKLEQKRQEYLKQQKEKEEKEEQRRKELEELQRQQEEQKRKEKEKLESKDKDKIEYLEKDITELISKYSFDSDRYQKLSNSIDTLLNKTIKYLKDNK